MTTPVTTVTPSVLNTPKPNGATQTQQPVAPKPNAAPAAESPEARLAAREAAIEKREKAFGAELNKFKDTNKGLGAKLSEYEQLKKKVPELEKYKTDREHRDQLRKLNPVAGLEEDFGKDWADRITSLRVNGVAPTELVASVVQQLRADFKAELDARDRKTAAASTAAEQSQVEEARAEVSQGASQWYEANAKEFPVFERLGDANRIGQILGDRIEQEFRRSGKLLTSQQAAEGLEADMLGIVETAVKSEKYKAKLQGETKPANVSGASGEVSGGDGLTSSTQHGGTRRTLDNSMTASTSGRAPPRSDAEREQRAMDAFNAVRAGRKV